MSSTVRVALTETRNVYTPMPATVAQLGELRGRLPQVRDANLDHNVSLIVSAVELGAQVVCLGELFVGPYFALGQDPMWIELAEEVDSGVTVTRLREVARKHQVIVVAPIYERVAATGRRFNTAVVIDQRGELLGIYRKTHIPAGANEQGAFCEQEFYEASDGELGDWPANLSTNPYFPVFSTSVGNLGVAICYDRHFPGAMRTLAENGAELVVCPAVTFGDKSRRMWELEFPVDAMRHNLFIGGSNRYGCEPPWSQEYFGASYFVGPNGRVPTIDGPKELVIADLPLAELAQPDPSGWDLARDRRRSIYG